MRGLSQTGNFQRNRNPFLSKGSVKACHGSIDDNERACKGYLAREGWRNLNVRIMLAKGQIESPSAVAEACEAKGVELEPDYPSVLEKLGRSQEWPGREGAVSMIKIIADLIRASKIDLSNEKQAQADVEHILIKAEIRYEREVRLTDQDIIDFLIQGVGVELKLKGARKKEVYRQLCRYARHPRIDVLLLASNLSMGLPATIEGKDVYFVKLGEAWL